jgi:F-type H+-transporting ATPase subunit gamma
MANIRLLDKRRKSIRNIRKITRTMELIATARFKKAMDRASAATDYTQRITQIVRDLANSVTEIRHPLLQARPETRNVVMLVLTSNRGLCGGYNSSVLRVLLAKRADLVPATKNIELHVCVKRGINGLKFKNLSVEKSYTQFEDKPAFADVAVIANELMERFIAGEIDRVDVAYTRFLSSSKQEAVVETLLPLAGLDTPTQTTVSADDKKSADYEFLPSAESILEEVVPASFRVKLFKCFLDAAVSEQIARMVAMKGATENAGDMIGQLSMTFNRARQARITREIMEIIGGVEALEG